MQTIKNMNAELDALAGQRDAYLRAFARIDWDSLDNEAIDRFQDEYETLVNGWQRRIDQLSRSLREAQLALIA